MTVLCDFLRVAAWVLLRAGTNREQETVDQATEMSVVFGHGWRGNTRVWGAWLKT